MRKKYIYILFAIIAAFLFFRFFTNRTEKEFMLEADKKPGFNSTDDGNAGNQINNGGAKQNVAGSDIAVPGKISIKVPFTSQSPLVQWSDREQQNGCEEASILMAWHWIQNTPFGNAEDVDRELKDFFAFERQNYGSSLDTSGADTMKMFSDYLGYQKLELVNEPSVNGIIAELAKGNILIAPFNGQVLNNPHYTQPGPERHMLVIIGYDNEKQIFITNDPGTKFGAGYKYSYDTLLNAIRDYPSGDNIPITENKKIMIVVSK